MNKKELEKLIGHKRSSHKFGAVRTTCNLGHKHPSKSEANHCWTLQMKQKQGLIRDLEYEPSFDLMVNGILIGKHKPDFTYINKSHKICVDEVKGFRTPDWKLKSKMFVSLYPHIEYRVL